MTQVSRICPQCFHENELADKLCNVCGTRLSDPRRCKTARIKEMASSASVYPTAATTTTTTVAATATGSAWRGEGRSLMHKIFRSDDDDHGPQPEAHLENQGAFVRLWAFLIDTVLVGLLCVFWPLWIDKVAGYQVEWYGHVTIDLAIAWLYFSIGLRSGYQASWGQCAAGIIVVTNDNQPLSWSRASLRFFCFLFSLASVLGIVWIAFSKKHAGWHDMLSKTKVVKVMWKIKDDNGQWVDYLSKKRQWFSLLR